MKFLNVKNRYKNYTGNGIELIGDGVSIDENGISSPLSFNDYINTDLNSFFFWKSNYICNIRFKIEQFEYKTALTIIGYRQDFSGKSNVVSYFLQVSAGDGGHMKFSYKDPSNYVTHVHVLETKNKMPLHTWLNAKITYNKNHLSLEVTKDDKTLIEKIEKDIILKQTYADGPLAFLPVSLYHDSTNSMSIDLKSSYVYDIDKGEIISPWSI